MNEFKQEKPGEKQPSFEVSNLYYVLVFLLVVISLVTINRNDTGIWLVSVGIRDTTTILVALAILPPLIRFLVRGTRKGEAELSGVGKISWENVTEIDNEIFEKQKIQEKAGEAAKDGTKSIEELEAMLQNADIDLRKTVTLQDMPFVQQLYLQKLNEAVKDFNRNRQKRPSGRSTVAQADAIAYRMRSMAPLLDGKIGIAKWLDSANSGKRLAAIKYLDWSQDIEFAQVLANQLQVLEDTGDTFQAFHILLALSSMADQLSYDYRDSIRRIIEKYTPNGNGASSRQSVKNRILKVLS